MHIRRKASWHEADFIRFKTNLLLEEAGKDPIKRAELIADIVRSISVIPEAIVRDVYIKECGSTLRVEEKLLVSEVAKLRERQAIKQAERDDREKNQGRYVDQSSSAANPAPPEGLISSDNTDQLAEEVYSSFIPQDGKEGREFYKYERLILQMVIRYGEKVMCITHNDQEEEVPITVTEYIVNDLREDDLAFHNPLHRQILSEASAHLNQNGFTAERYFLSHPDPSISKLCAELISNRYQLSKYHSKTQKLVSDEERLYELVPMLMVNFKYAIVSEELKHMADNMMANKKGK